MTKNTPLTTALPKMGRAVFFRFDKLFKVLLRFYYDLKKPF